MKTTILLIRHGFSTSNEDATLTGQSDAPLTPLGRLQGDAASRYLLENYKIDAVYSSDLSRAVDTVRLLAAAGYPVKTDPALREMSCGAWEGEKIALLKERYGETYARWSDADDTVVPEGGEAWSAVSKRMLAALLKIAEAHAGETVAVATHGGALRALRGAYLGIPMEAWKEKLPYAPNASTTVVVYENGAFTEEAVIDGYLGDLKTEMPRGL
ncbi:MAG: histidine phosphatase family protein [Clostridia bacterium]|nr:histidine phosphatase family protein [Clostridia bacterium]